MATSPGPKTGRKFLRAFRCPPGARSAPIRCLAPAAGPAALLLAALIPPLRPALAILLVVGWTLLRVRRSPAAIAWAAALPVALLLTWPWILGADVPLGEAGCVEPTSAIVVRRVIAAIAVLGVVAALAAVHDSDRGELGLRRPTGPETVAAVVGAVVLAAGGLYVGPWIARPFFGELSFPVPVAALLPALVFGIANGVVEEVAYRGSLQAWLGRLATPWVAIGFQGLVFGIVHAGPEVVALLPVHVALLTAVGVAGGVARRQLGSLWIPIGIHVGADVALYVGLACRVAG